MYGVSFYITPEDVLNKLTEEGQKRFNKCIFTDVIKDRYGSGITIECMLFNSEDEIETSGYRYRLFDWGELKWFYSITAC